MSAVQPVDQREGIKDDGQRRPMHLEITRIEGLRNDLLLRLERAEIETARCSASPTAIG